MGYKIKEWKQFQHFKDRTPPWIKLYRYLLDDPDWHELSGDSAKKLVMLWLIASEDPKKSGNLPNIRKIAFRLRITEKQTSDLLKKLGHWVLLEQDDIKTISRRYQDDAPETETETETETDKKKYIKKNFGEFKNVKLTSDEFEKLQNKFPDYKSKIEDLSCYIESKGKKYKSHYSTILMWDRKNMKETKGKSGVLQPTTYAQAQDAERRQRAAWLLKEMENDNDEDGGEGIDKAIPLLPSD